MLAAGTQLGPYHVVEKLGEGGMGEVYRARDARLKRYNPNTGGAIMRVPYTVAGGVLRPGTPQRLHEAGILSFDIHPDGERFVVETRETSRVAAPDQDRDGQDRDGQDRDGQDRDTVVLILNVFDELRRLVPPR